MINHKHLGDIERLALQAVRGEELPKDYSAKLLPHGSPCIKGDIEYVRLAIIRDGVEVGDVGLACRNDGWAIAGSGYRPL